MEKVYHLHLCILTAKKLATIIEVLDHEAEMISCKEHSSDEIFAEGQPRGWPASRPAHEHKTPHRYVGGRRNKGIDGEELVLKVLSNHWTKLSVVESAFKRYGFAQKSANSRLSKMKSMGLVEQGKGTNAYRLTSLGLEAKAKLQETPVLPFPPTGTENK